MAVDMELEDPNIMDTLAESYFAAGEFERAIEWEQKSLDLEPESVFSTRSLINILNTLKDNFGQSKVTDMYPG